MTDLTPYDVSMAEEVSAFWQKLYPEWNGASNPAEINRILTSDRVIECVTVRRDNRLIATVSCTRQKSPDGYSNIWISTTSEPGVLSASLQTELLRRFSDVDAEIPGTWHIISPRDRFPADLEAVLTEFGFKLDRMTREMEWTGDSVLLVDAGHLRVQNYNGGDPDIDRSIIDLHNRSYRSLRLVSQLDETNVWKPYTANQASRGIVICWDEDQMVSFAEWSVIDGQPIISSIVCARSHWGTATAAAAGTRAMQCLVDRGHRRILSYSSTRNAASHKLQLRFGWREVKVMNPIYVRKV
jgi:hypothetical protein